MSMCMKRENTMPYPYYGNKMITGNAEGVVAQHLQRKKELDIERLKWPSSKRSKEYKPRAFILTEQP